MTPFMLAVLLAPAQDLDAKAALALAAASQPKQPNTPPPCEYLPNCTCGCQQGGPCTCGPQDGARDGEWTYDATTRKWWKYEAITPPVLPDAPVALPALLPTHLAPAPMYMSPRMYTPAFRLAPAGAGFGGGSFFRSGGGGGGC